MRSINSVIKSVLVFHSHGAVLGGRMLRMAMRWLGFATARILPWRVIELKSDPIRVASPTIANPKLRVPTNTDREKVRERERES